jgi:hypothetical protein
MFLIVIIIVLERSNIRARDDSGYKKRMGGEKQIQNSVRELERHP